MSAHRSALLAAAIAAALAAPRSSAAPAGGASTPARSPSGLVASFSLGAGGELGLEQGQDEGVGEVEVIAAWESPGWTVRPELGLTAGFWPDGHVALRPGGRIDLSGLPLALRFGIDLSTSRGDGLRFRWLLVGLAAEVRLTGELGLFGEVDSGAPLGDEFGVPLVGRVGASFRF